MADPRIEAAARALAKKAGARPGDWGLWKADAEAALAAADAVAGWKVVPVEPTEAMHSAANREWDGRMSARVSGVWQAMLAASPSPAKD